MTRAESVDRKTPDTSKSEETRPHSKTDRTERVEKTDKSERLRQPSPHSNLDRQWRLSSRYRVKQIIGTGSYGSVAEAWDSQEKRLVAIKRMQHLFTDLVDCKRILREVTILSKLRHDHIIRVFDIMVPRSSKVGSFDELYLVMEICDSDLKKLIRTGISLSSIQIDTLLYNTLVGLKYIHSANIYHRDLKPANILVNQDCSVKICDFGLARAVGEEFTKPGAPSPRGEDGSADPGSARRDSSGTPRDQPRRLKRNLTGHVVSRWYRAPELILLQEAYTSAIDVWSVGCIYAELLGMLEGAKAESKGPLFPGSTCFPLSPDHKHKTDYRFHTHGQVDQLNMIFNLLGLPCDRDIEELEREDSKQYIRCFTKRTARSLSARLPQAGADALDLLEQMLRFSPSRRTNVKGALRHELFREIRVPGKEKAVAKQITLDFEKEPELDEDLLRQYFTKEIAKYGTSS